METTELSTGSRRTFPVWIPALISLMALGTAAYALVLVRTTMESQASLLEVQEELRQAVSDSKMATQPTIPLENLTKFEKRSTALIRPTVLIPLEGAKDSAESIQMEMEQVVASLQSQYPKLPDALHVVAMMKAQTRKFAEAQELWQQCIRLAPQQELYYVNLASVAMEQGNNELALNTMRQGVALGFDSFDVMHHFALALSNLGLYDETIQVIERSLKKFPTAASHWLLLGQAQLEQEKNSDAELSFRKALNMGANSPGVYVGLGNACVRQGKRDEGATYLKTFAQLKSQDKLSGQERYQILSDQEIKQTASTVFTEAATVYFRQKEPLHTERLLLRCVALAPKSQSPLRALADFYFKSKLLAEERVVRGRILELGTDLFSDYIDLAKVCAQMEDRESVEATLKLAMTLYPQSIEPYAALSQVFLEAGKLDKARWFAQQSIERGPSADGFRFLAAICEKQHDTQAAAEALRLAKQLEAKP